MSKTKTIVYTILVVDDDPEYRDFVSSVIGSEYSLLSASSGEDAIHMAQQEHPDVIVLDVMMSTGMDGFMTFARLQADKKTRDIPVLMLSDVNGRTGLSFGVDEMRRQLGGTPAAFLQKPISAGRLMKELRGVLKKTAAQ